MIERVYLRKADADTVNECWVICAKNDVGAVEFICGSDAIATIRELGSISAGPWQNAMTLAARALADNHHDL